ncbi:MAG: hypothetical protein ACI8W8_004335 [Rhodothermales bacterium]|jgi:hypothetical protein
MPEGRRQFAAPLSGSRIVAKPPDLPKSWVRGIVDSGESLQQRQGLSKPIVPQHEQEKGDIVTVCGEGSVHGVTLCPVSAAVFFLKRIHGVACNGLWLRIQKACQFFRGKEMQEGQRKLPIHRR